MTKSIYILILLLCSSFISAQSDYWQQHVEYKINAQLDTSTHIIKAECGIQYFNNSPDTLDRIYFHLWANAFSNKTSSFADQAIKMGMTDYYFADDGELGGYQEITVALSSEEGELQLIYLDDQKEIAHVQIKGGVPPGEEICLIFYYELKIPNYFARLGKSNNLYNMVAWYPKPAVYDRNGWHTFPYLSMGEFYSEFANYEVTLSAPKGNTIAHSGYETKRYTNNDYQYKETRLENAHDYAWFVSPDFIIEEEKVTLNNNQIVHVKIYRKPDDTIWPEAMLYTKQVLIYMADYMGDYPYSTLSIVQGEDSGLVGAMEYPSIKIIKNVRASDALEYYIAHEVGHAWFYAAIGSNERDESYFDEGLTSFLEQKYTAHYHEGDNYQNNKLPSFLLGSDKPILRHFTEGQICRHLHQPLTTPVAELSTINYGLNAYQIGSTLIAHTESLLGFNKVREILRSFYTEWKFKHPIYKDLLSHIERESKINLSGYNDILAGHAVDASISKVAGGTITITNKGKSEIMMPLLITYEDGTTERENVNPSQQDLILEKYKNIKSAILDPDQTSLDINPENNRYPRPGIGIRIFTGFDSPGKKDIYLSPLIGYNSYDGIMLGLSMYNSTFPAKNLKWNITPFYGFDSGQLVGQSWISYDTKFKSDKIRKIQYRLGIKSFSIANNEDANIQLRYIRIDPCITLHHYHNSASKLYSKTSLRQLWTGTDISYLEIDRFTQNITRLIHNRYNFDKLQPNELEVELEYNQYHAGSFLDSQDYLKLSLDYRHGFLFGKHRKLDIRLFAAKFLMNSQRQSSSYNNLLAQGSIALLNQGFTDYSYNDYYFDRQGQSKRAYRQIGYHGGGFKDALGSANGRIGQSNDFAMAINLKTHLPFGQAKLPLKLFFDAGYARTKSFSADPLKGEVFYSGGVMIEIGDGLFAFHLPLIVSQKISDIYKSESRNLLSKITFSMDLHRWNPWELADDYIF